MKTAILVVATLTLVAPPVAGQVIELINPTGPLLAALLSGSCQAECRTCGETAKAGCGGDPDNVANYRCYEDAPGRCVCEYSCKGAAAMTAPRLVGLPEPARLTTT